MQSLAGPFAVAAGLLVLGGESKARRPDSTVRALGAAGARVPAALVRLFGAAEVAIGISAVLVGGRLPGALVAASYAGFTAFVAVALRRRTPLASCGCFGRPDLLVATGARIREVGTTNRTVLGDYADAIGPDTAFVLKVHPANFRVEGFTAAVDVRALATLGAPVVVDVGSGLLRPDPLLPAEPTAAGTLRAGAVLVTASGDKLLGGPQAGLVLGDAALVAQLRRHPLAVTSTAPARSVPAAVGSAGSSGSGRSRPEPTSTTTGAPSVASARTSTAAVKPSTRKLAGCTLSTKAVSGPIASA